MNEVLFRPMSRSRDSSTHQIETLFPVMLPIFVFVVVVWLGGGRGGGWRGGAAAEPKLPAYMLQSSQVVWSAVGWVG